MSKEQDIESLEQLIEAGQIELAFQLMEGAGIKWLPVFDEYNKALRFLPHDFYPLRPILQSSLKLPRTLKRERFTIEECLRLQKICIDAKETHDLLPLVKNARFVNVRFHKTLEEATEILNNCAGLNYLERLDMIVRDNSKASPILKQLPSYIEMKKRGVFVQFLPF